MRLCTCRRNQSASTLRTPKSVETLVCVADEGKAGGILVVSRLRSLCPVSSAVVVLVDLINGEVLSVNVGLQLRLEWCTNASQTIPRDAAEERMLLDLAGSPNAAETVVGVADQAKKEASVNESAVTTQGRLTASQTLPPPHRVAGLAGSASCVANLRSYGRCHGALRRRMEASR